MKRSINIPANQKAFLGWVRFSKEGTMWLFAVVLVGFIGWWRSINVIFLLAYFMICLLALNVLLAALHVRRLKVSRETQLPVYAGEEAVIRLTVTNSSSRSATAIVDDRIAGEAVGWLLADIPGRATVSCSVRRTFANRGRLTSQAKVSSGYPIGLISIARNASAGDITVLPALGTIYADGLRRWVHRKSGNHDHSRKVLRLVTTDQADVRGVRPYRPGDQIRTIHWKLSAHRGEFMVREYDSSPTPELILVVEPWLPPTYNPRQLDDLEAALSLATTLAVNWGKIYGTGVTIAIAGEPGSIRTTSPFDRGIRESLIPLASAEGGMEFEALERVHFDRSFSRGVCLMVSSRPNSPYARQISRTTGHLFVAVSPEERLPWYLPPPRRDGGKQSNASVISLS